MRFPRALAALIVLFCVPALAIEPDLVFSDGFGEEAPGHDPPAGECAGVTDHGYERVTALVVSTWSLPTETRDATTLAGIYGGQVTTRKVHWALRPGQYVAFAFTGAELEAALPGRSHYSPGGEPQTGAPYAAGASITISRCAGDFRWGHDAPGQICRGDTIGTPASDIVHFAIGDVASRGLIPNACTVDRGTTYYLNVVFAIARDGLAPAESVCRDDIAACGWRWNIE